MEYKDISESIVSMKNADLELRNKLIQQGKLSDGYNVEMEKLHNKNANKLNEIIDQIGYPTEEKVGKEANEASWLIIQHSIGQPEFMKKCLKLLMEEVKEEPTHIAYLSDRIAVFEGEVQLWGTQFDWDENGQLSPSPHDHIKEVNRRRRSIGLNSLEEQIRIIRIRAKAENQTAPEDLAKRNKEMQDWKQKVGWIN